MTWRRSALAPALLCAIARGQQTIGHVTLEDAMLSGTLEVTQGQATLRGGASIVAKDHTAELALDRGGTVAVCSTSSLHVTAGMDRGAFPPLLFALDRGAMEIHAQVGQRDAVITPDLRLSPRSAGALDLRVRVVSNGDTCVENRGAGAPPLEVVEQFGDGVYQVAAGQHVMFEHGSIREVVDRESSPCGCPPTPVMSLAATGVTVAPGQAARPGSQAAEKREEHPFPAAESQGLAATSAGEIPQTPPGQVKTQVSASIAYTGDAESPTSGTNSSSPAPPASVAAKQGDSEPNSPATPGAHTASAATPRPAPAKVESSAGPAPPGATDIAHRIGRFFKRLFRG